jgi:hypothetical protein
VRQVADGIWASGRFTDGYSNCIWDVEHAAEESSYSQPRMVLLDYGNPKWIERCLDTIEHFGFWTDINPQGHRHFKSYLFQANQIGTGEETDSDAADNARAMKPGNYVLWYNGSEPVARWFTEWADAWVEDALKTERGKPAGVLPGEIVFATCQIGREGSPWDRVKRYGDGHYTYHTEDELVTAYHLTRDPKYLKPIEAMIAHGRSSEMAAVNWRKLTGDTQFDEKFIASGRGRPTAYAYLAWLATGDRSFLADGLVEAVRDFERTRYLITEAEPPTDRVPLPGNLLLRQMALGGVGVYVAGWPQLAVSWEGTDYDVAPLVLQAASDELTAVVVNFGPDRRVRMRLWELEPGVYEVTAGPDRDLDDRLDQVAYRHQQEVVRGTRVEIPLPGQAVTVVHLSQQERIQLPETRPDLALGPDDVEVADDRRSVAVTVHNVGSAPSPEAVVEVRTAEGQVLGSAKVEALAPPIDLQPKVVQVAVALEQPLPDSFLVQLALPEGTREITVDNNQVGVE